MTSRIELFGMKFFAHHGVYDHERQNGGWFLVDVGFNCKAINAIKNDVLDDTVNYEEIYKIVKEEMEIPSHLIEHVAGRIHNRILNEVKGVYKLSTKVYKLNAPLGGGIEHVSICLVEE